MTRCVTDLALERYVLGELDDAHIASCAQCLAAVVAKRRAGDAYMKSPQARDLARLIATAEPALVTPPHRRRVLVPALAVALAAFAAYMVWPRAAPNREAEVLAVEREWTDAIVHNDVTALDAILAPDYKFTDSTGKITTKSEDLAGMREMPSRFDAYDTTDLQVRVWGDTAVITGRSVMRGSGAHGPFQHDITFTDTLARIDGRWRAVAAHASRTKP
jgi:ketosteroid isomerase-like protein